MSLLSPYFLTTRNITNLGFQTSIVAVLALGQLLVILTRGIDLSVGTVVALARRPRRDGGGRSAGGASSGTARSVLVAMIGCRPGRRGRERPGPRQGPGDEPVHRHARDARASCAAPRSSISDAQTVTGMPAAVQDDRDGQDRPAPGPGLIVLALAALAAWVMLHADAVGPLDLRRRRRSRRRAACRASRSTACSVRSTCCAGSPPASPRCSSPGGRTPARRRPASSSSSTRSPP